MTLFPPPGSDGSTVTVQSHYDNWIGGQWVAPVKGQYFENVTPVTGKVFCEIARSTAEDIELALDAGARRGRGLGPDVGRPSGPASCSRSPTGWRRTSTDLAVAETWDNGKPIRETHRRRPAAGRRPLPLLRRCDPRPGGLDRRDRRRHRGLPLPRAAGRRRPDHPLELPDPDGRVEARPGPRRRQLRRAQAGRADPVVDPQAHRADRRPAARRRAQHRQRLRRRGGQAARVAARASPRSPSPARPRPAG